MDDAHGRAHSSSATCKSLGSYFSFTACEVAFAITADATVKGFDTISSIGKHSSTSTTDKRRYATDNSIPTTSRKHDASRETSSASVASSAITVSRSSAATTSTARFAAFSVL
jgi:hypothetical protein